MTEMQRAVDHVFIWSPVNIFTGEAVTNTQNDRLFARDAGELAGCISTNFTVYETSWSDGLGRSRF